MLPDPDRKRAGLGRTLGLLAALALIVFGAFWLLDFLVIRRPEGDPDQGPLAFLLAYDPDTMQNALGNLAQIIAAVLGIAITVVSIVVQLASTRYTSRVADMFFRDKTNLTIMGFFVVSCVVAVWVSLSVHRGYAPVATITMTVVLVSVSLLILIPYFAYVFDFLDPEKVIARIGEQTIDNALGRHRAASDLVERQTSTVASMEQLTDIAVNAFQQRDKIIASDTIASLRHVVVAYLPAKGGLPAAWFTLGPRMRENPDFVAMASESVDDIAARRTWVEWKALRQFRTIFAEALKAMPEMAHVVAIETRYVGEAALRDPEVLALCVKYFNTYLRAALNARDIRTAYNVFNQYRQFAEAVLHAGLTDEAIEIGGHFKYYGQLAHGMGLGFVTETAAYDLCALCERAFDAHAPAHDALLRTFLEVDKEAESAAQEKALRGVRKAQAKLATYYLLGGAEDKARQIFRDMEGESPERLRSIREEMLGIRSKDFWEVIDRGTNFDYLPEARKDKLREFFRWFPKLAVLLALLATAGSACSHDLAHRVDDAVLVPVPPAERQAVFAAQADLDKARQERDFVRRQLADLDKEMAIVRKEAEQAEAEMVKQQIEEGMAEQSKEPARVNAAERWKHVAGMKQKVADAHSDFLSLRGPWLDRSLGAIEARTRASDARVELERARLCQRKGIRPGPDFAPEAFEAQHKEADGAARSLEPDLAAAAAQVKAAEERWKKLAVELTALGGT